MGAGAGKRPPVLAMRAQAARLAHQCEDAGVVVAIDGDWRYTIEGEKLTMGEIIARVLAAHPKLKADTIRKRVTAGFRTWRLLGQSAAAGAAARRDRIRSAIHRVYGRDR